ncbi:hypothetical protein D3C81_2205420 [compost metagenome]
MGVADRLARLGAQVGEGNRGVAVAEGDGAGLLDLLQGAAELFGKGRAGQQGDGDGTAQQTGGDTHECFLDLLLGA